MEQNIIYKVSIVDENGNITNANMGYYSGIAALRKRFGHIIDGRGEELEDLSGRNRVYFRQQESDESRKQQAEFMAMLGQTYRESWYAIEPVEFYSSEEDF